MGLEDICLCHPNVTLSIEHKHTLTVAIYIRTHQRGGSGRNTKHCCFITCNYGRSTRLNARHLDEGLWHRNQANEK